MVNNVKSLIPRNNTIDIKYVKLFFKARLHIYYCASLRDFSFSSLNTSPGQFFNDYCSCHNFPFIYLPGTEVNGAGFLVEISSLLDNVPPGICVDSVFILLVVDCEIVSAVRFTGCSDLSCAGRVVLVKIILDFRERFGLEFIVLNGAGIVRNEIKSNVVLTKNVTRSIQEHLKIHACIHASYCYLVIL